MGGSVSSQQSAVSSQQSAAPQMGWSVSSQGIHGGSQCSSTAVSESNSVRCHQQQTAQVRGRWGSPRVASVSQSVSEWIRQRSSFISGALMSGLLLTLSLTDSLLAHCRRSGKFVQRRNDERIKISAVHWRTCYSPLKSTPFAFLQSIPA